MGAKHADDANRPCLADGLSHEETGPTEKGEKSEVVPGSYLGGWTQSVELMGGSERLRDVERAVFLEDPGVGEEGAEVTICDVFLGEVDAFCGRRTEDGRAWALCGGEDVVFDEACPTC
jgi:hypothetical protein